MSGISMENIEPKDSPDSKLQIQFTCSVEILSILEVIEEMLNRALNLG